MIKEEAVYLKARGEGPHAAYFFGVRARPNSRRGRNKSLNNVARARARERADTDATVVPYGLY